MQKCRSVVVLHALCVCYLLGTLQDHGAEFQRQSHPSGKSSCVNQTSRAHIARWVYFKNVEQSFNDSRTNPARAFLVRKRHYTEVDLGRPGAGVPLSEMLVGCCSKRAHVLCMY